MELIPTLPEVGRQSEIAMAANKPVYSPPLPFSVVGSHRTLHIDLAFSVDTTIQLNNFNFI